MRPRGIYAESAQAFQKIRGPPGFSPLVLGACHSIFECGFNLPSVLSSIT